VVGSGSASLLFVKEGLQIVLNATLEGVAHKLNHSLQINQLDKSGDALYFLRVQSEEH